MAKARSRGNIKLTKFGTYEVRWSYELDGKRKQGSKSFKSGTEAKKFLTSKLKELDEGTHVAPTRLSVKQYMEEWLDLAVRWKDYAPLTVQQYEGITGKHIIPALGKFKLQTLTAKQIDEFYASKRHLSLRRQKIIHAVLRMALAQAVKWQYLKISPMTGATPPKGVPEHVGGAYEPHELNAILEKARECTIWIGVYLGIHTGMRLAEIVRVRWEDVDFESGSLTINIAKSGKPRTIELAEEVLAELQQHKGKQAAHRLVTPNWVDHGLVFPNLYGQQRSADAFGGQWYLFIRGTGLRVLRFHDLRHTHATLLLQAKESVSSVSERLGHANGTVTLSTYAHVLKGERRATAERFSELLRTGTEP